MVFEKLRDIICEQLELDPSEVTLESNMEDDFNADSLDFVDIVMSIEDEFGVEIPEDLMDGQLSTVKDVVDYIENHR